MRTAPRKTIAALAIALALTVTPVLSGCGGIQGVIEQATGGAIQPSVGELPNGWPTEVPVIDGEIVGGNKATDPENENASLWTAIITSAVDEAATRAAVVAAFEGAGFEGLTAPR